MVIKIRKNIVGFIAIYIAFILPYIEINAIRNKFEYAKGNIYIPSVFPIMLIIYLITFFINRINKNHKKAKIYYIKKTVHIFRIYSFYLLFILIISFSHISSYVQLMEFVLPFLYAKEMVIFILSYGFDIKTISKHGIICFITFQLIFLLVNIKLYGFSFNGNSESRIISVGGGPVILGYTIALVTILWICFKEKETKFWHIIIFLSAIILSIATGSRGSMWPLFAVLFFYFASKKGHICPIKLIILFFLGTIIILSFDFSDLIPRFYDITDNSRLITVTKGFEAYKHYNLIQMLFGKGIGNFFPIQSWNVNESLFTNYNQWNFEGITLLVQPHNAYIYTLLESGVIGIIFFISILDSLLKKGLFQMKKIEFKMFAIVVIFIFFIESTVYVAVGSASLWWIVIMFYSIGVSEEHNPKLR